jgi:Zn-dependent protease with chaperone function
MRGTYFRGKSGSQQVEVTCGGGDLVVQAEGGEQRLPFDQCDLALGGTHDSSLVLTLQRGGEEHVVYLERKGLIAQLEAGDAPPWLVDRVRELISVKRRKWALSRTIILSVAALVLGLVGLLAWQANDLAVDAIPPAWEEELGKQAFEGYSSELTLSEDPRLVGFVEDLGARLLASQTDQPYTFRWHVAMTDEVNAFALPGGFVVVNSGLIAQAGSPEEVAGVIGHEISHVLLRHSVRQGVKRVGIMAAIALIFDPTSVVQFEAAMSLLNLKFSRDHESEADALGARILHDARIDPRNLGLFFARLADMEVVGVPEFISTHPQSENRTQEVEALAASFPAVSYEAIECDWETIQALARGEGEDPEDAPLSGEVPAGP